MTFLAYDLWRYVHVLLFVYWLGADLGVYYAAKYVARADLDFAERMRFLDLTLLLDMGPRTGLVLLFPVGFQLWAMSPLVGISNAVVLGVWGAFVAWLVLVWGTHWQKKTKLGDTLRKLDLGIRYFVIATMIGLGITSLLWQEPFGSDWLSWKVLLYGCVIGVGVYLRRIISAWGTGFAMVKDGQVDQGNALIQQAAVRGEWGAYLLWALVALIAFLGVTKPL